MPEERLRKLIEESGLDAIRQATMLLLTIMTDDSGNAEAVAGETKD
jgi:hypothetical protein